jgi:hemolysin activation/secretion protein
MFFIFRKSPVVLVILVAAMVAVFSLSAPAQEKAGAVLKELERKEITSPKAAKKPVIEQKKEEAVRQIPAGTKILVQKINVTVQGKSPAEAKPLLGLQIITAITSKYENKELDLAQMNMIAEEITTAYRNEGYLVAYALIPQQEIKDGILQITVIESKVGQIDVTGNTSYSSNFIQKHLQKTKKDPSLREATLDRALLILNDYPSLDVKAALKAGKDFGTTDITAQVKDSRPLSGSLSYDNFGSDTTSKSRLNAELNIGNLITSGDLLMLRGLTGLDKIDLENLSYGRIEYIIPVMYSGTKAGIYYSNSIYEAGEQYAILDIQGKAHVAGAYLTHPLVKTRATSLDVKFGFDYKDIYEYMLDETTSEDNIRVFNLGLNYNVVDGFYGRNILNITYYQGIRDLFGGNGANDPETSRINADGGFSKGTLDLARVQKLPGYNHLILRASGQYSNDDLFVAEQFFIGGVGSIRGFSPSALSGDKGYSISGELYIAPPYPETKIFNQNLGDTVKLVLFADHGGVFKNDVQPGEDKNDYLTSIGVGLRLYATQYVSARLDWGVPRIDGHFETGDSETYVQLVFNF